MYHARIPTSHEVKKNKYSTTHIRNKLTEIKKTLWDGDELFKLMKIYLIL